MSGNSTLIFGTSHREENVGKKIKHSKKRLTWEFDHESHKHQVDLDLSMVSCKGRIKIDGKLIKEFSKKIWSSFAINEQFKFCTMTLKLEGHHPKIELWIDGLRFSEMMNYEPQEKSMESEMTESAFPQQNKMSISSVLAELKNGSDYSKGDLRRTVTVDLQNNFSSADRIPTFNSEPILNFNPLNVRLDLKPEPAKVNINGNHSSEDPDLKTPPRNLLTTEWDVQKLDAQSKSYKVPIVVNIKEWRCEKLSPYEIKTEEYILPERSANTEQRNKLIQEMYPK